MMEEYTVHLRYYPGDPLREIRQEDLDRIAKAHGVAVAFEKIDNRASSDGMLREETLDKTIEEITQEVITVRSDDEKRFREAVAVLYETYRAPRTPYGFWGSSRGGGRIAKAMADETGGGW
jgi:hypothetical protein